MSTWDRPDLGEDLGVPSLPLRRRRTARSCASREASNTDKIDCLRSLFMAGTSAWVSVGWHTQVGLSIERNIDRLKKGQPLTSGTNRIKTNLDENVETPVAGYQPAPQAQSNSSTSGRRRLI